jgi:hypothetical protein
MGGERAVARVYPDGLLDFISNRLPLQEGIWSLENLSRPR